MSIESFNTSRGHEVSHIQSDQAQGLISAQVKLQGSDKVQTITIRNAKFDKDTMLDHLKKRVDEAALMQLRYGSGGTKQIIWKPEQGTVERVLEHGRPVKAWKPEQKEQWGKDTKTHDVKDDLAKIDQKIGKNEQEKNTAMETRTDLAKIILAKGKELQPDKAWLDSYERTKDDLKAPLPPELKAIKPSERLQYIDNKKDQVLRKKVEIEKLQKAYDENTSRIQKLDQRISALKTYGQAMRHIRPTPTFTPGAPATALPLAESTLPPEPLRPGEHRKKAPPPPATAAPPATPKKTESFAAEAPRKAQEPPKEESLLRKPLPPVPKKAPAAKAEKEESLFRKPLPPIPKKAPTTAAETPEPAPPPPPPTTGPVTPSAEKVVERPPGPLDQPGVNPRIEERRKRAETQ